MRAAVALSPHLDVDVTGYRGGGRVPEQARSPPRPPANRWERLHWVR